MQTIYIVSSGSFYRPTETPAGGPGWVGEITFWYAPLFTGEKIPNISKTFSTQAEADDFVYQELLKLFQNKEYKIRDYNGNTRPITVTQ